MTGKLLGATHQVLRTYYVYAVRSIVDYTSTALVTVQDNRLQELEKVQSKAAWIVLGALKWTKVMNLQLKASLTPLSLRVKRLAVDFLAPIPRLKEPGSQGHTNPSHC